MGIKVYIIGSFTAYFIGLLILAVMLDIWTFIGIVLYFGGATTLLIVIVTNYTNKQIKEEQRK